jgi:ribonuclease HI
MAAVVVAQLVDIVSVVDSLINVWTDALCQPHNPGGIVTYGFVIDLGNGYAPLKFDGFIGSGDGMSNNVGEFKAVSLALTQLLTLNVQKEKIVLHTDSQLVANQLNNFWRIKGGDYLKYFYEAKVLVENFTDLKIVWVPREQNKLADKLSQLAYHEFCNHNNIPYKFNPHRRKTIPL